VWVHLASTELVIQRKCWNDDDGKFDYKVGHILGLNVQTRVAQAQAHVQVVLVFAVHVRQTSFETCYQCDALLLSLVLVVLGCGSSIAENCTYFQSSTTSQSVAQCGVQICKCSTDICQV